MIVKSRFKYSGFTPKAPARELNNARRSSFQELGEHFFDVNLPLRFTFYGVKLLGLQSRTTKYQRRKRKEKGHNLPFVWSGTTRDRVLSSLTRIKAAATSNKSHVALTINAPALNLRASASSPNLREEITRVADREIGPLERVLLKAMETNFIKLEKAS